MDDLSLMLHCLREAGAIALKFHGQNPKVWNKPDGTVVTEADIAVDDYLKSTIRAARPDDGWLSEETKDTPERLSKSRLWIADPIDGTRAFSNATRFWGVGLALTAEGAPVMGGIYCPVDDVLYHAVKGGGAFRNGTAIVPPNDKGPAIVPRRAIGPVEAAGFATQVSSEWPLLLRFALVAEGRNAAAISIGDKQDWDLAAGHLLVTETGGVVTTSSGAPLRYNQSEHQQPGLVATQQRWHESLIKAVGTL